MKNIFDFKKIKSIYSYFIICFLCISLNTFYAKSTQAQALVKSSDLLKIGTMELPPYGWKNSKEEKFGIIYEMNEQIGKRSGMKYSNEILPFNRMLQMLKKGEIDLISSQAHKASLAAGDKLAIQFSIDVIAGTRKGSLISQLSSFKNKHLLHHRSASYKQLKGLPKKISRVDSYKQMLRLISYRKTFDAGVFSEPAYYYWMKNLDLSPKDFGEVVLIEGGKEQWILVRKNMPEAMRIKLSKIVKKVYAEGLYDKLLKKYGKD